MPIPQQWFANVVGDGIADNQVLANQDVSLIVPRRNHGPIVQSLAGGQALRVQFSGFSARRALESLYLWHQARTLRAFGTVLRRFDFGPQNGAQPAPRGTKNRTTP